MNIQQNYLIVSAIIRRGNEVLLVAQKGPEDVQISWALPSGQVAAGESLLAGLRREVLEETGLTVKVLGSLVAVQQGHWTADRLHVLVFIFEVAGWEGDLQPQDPDHIVLRAEFMPILEAVQRLAGLPPFMAEPSVARLTGQTVAPTFYYYLDGQMQYSVASVSIATASTRSTSMAPTRYA